MILMEKKCTKCNAIKHVSEFNKNNQCKNGIFSMCRECSKRINKEYNRSIDGTVKYIFRKQISASRSRGHNLPEYSFKEFYDFLIENKTFIDLHKRWIEDNFLKLKKPTVDRLDNTKGYSFENIQIVTWEENKKNYDIWVKNGNPSSVSKPVLRFSLHGNFIDEYPSITIAAKTLNIDKRQITKACKGEYKQYKGFIWKYKHND